MLISVCVSSEINLLSVCKSAHNVTANFGMVLKIIGKWHDIIANGMQYWAVGVTKWQVGKLIVTSHHLIVLLFPFWPTILKFTVDGHARTNYVQYLNTTIQLNKVQSVEDEQS